MTIKTETNSFMVELDVNSDDASIEEWLGVIADTCVEHVRYMDQVEEDEPEALTVDDFGMRELEKAFLYLYAVHKGILNSGGLSSEGEVKH